jgi:hypothetical protein
MTGSMTVISIQSQVAYGHVGNRAAVFPMQSRGVDVIAVPTPYGQKIKSVRKSGNYPIPA